MVTAWCNRQILAPITFKGHCNTVLFEAWVEQLLVPALHPGQVMVLEHASFHKSARTQMLIAQAGCRVLFLASYSPDLNKIEKFWARLSITCERRSSSFKASRMRLMMPSENCPN